MKINTDRALVQIRKKIREIKLTITLLEQAKTVFDTYKPTTINKRLITKLQEAGVKAWLEKRNYFGDTLHLHLSERYDEETKSYFENDKVLLYNTETIETLRGEVDKDILCERKTLQTREEEEKNIQEIATKYLAIKKLEKEFKENYSSFIQDTLKDCERIF